MPNLKLWNIYSSPVGPTMIHTHTHTHTRTHTHTPGRPGFNPRSSHTKDFKNGT